MSRRVFNQTGPQAKLGSCLFKADQGTGETEGARGRHRDKEERIEHRTDGDPGSREYPVAVHRVQTQVPQHAGKQGLRAKKETRRG